MNYDSVLLLGVSTSHVDRFDGYIQAHAQKRLNSKQLNGRNSHSSEIRAANMFKSESFYWPRHFGQMRTIVGLHLYSQYC